MKDTLLLIAAWTAAGTLWVIFTFCVIFAVWSLVDALKTGGGGTSAAAVQQEFNRHMDRWLTWTGRAIVAFICACLVTALAL